MLILFRITFGLAAFLAWPLTRLVPRYRAVAVVLTAGLALDLLRGALRLALVHEGRPFMGWARVAFHVDQGALLAFPALSAGLALVVMAAERPRLVAAVVGAVWFQALLVTIVGYPGLRGEVLLDVYHREQECSVAVGLVSAGMLLLRWGLRGETIGPPARAALLLLAGDAAQLFGPWLGAPVEHWAIWQLQSALCLGTLAVLELKWAAARRAIAAG